MPYLLIIDGDEDSQRPAKFAKQFKLTVPEMSIYWCYSNDEQVYKYKCYQANDDLFQNATLPSEAATLALWHYRDKSYSFAIKPIITIGFGGGGAERNSHPNISYHIASILANANQVAALKERDLRELWDWACNRERSDTDLPNLIRGYDFALLALQLLCQGYLKVYDDPIANAKAISKQRDLVNTRNWWLSPFNTVEDLQGYFIHYTKIPNNPIGELIEVIQQSDCSIVANEQKLRQICLQCLKV